MKMTNQNNQFDAHYDVILTGTDFISSLLSAALARIGKKVLSLDSEKFYGKEWRSMKFTDLLIWSVRHRHLHSLINEDNHSDKLKPALNSDDELYLSMHRSQRFKNVEIEFDFITNQGYCQKFFEHLFKDKCTKEFLEDFTVNCQEKLSNEQSIDEAMEILENFKDKYPLMNRFDNMFTFDLCPRFLYSNEKLVKLLIDSTVTRYVEFKKISRLLTVMSLPETSDDNDNGENRMNMQIVEVPCTRSDIFMSNIISPIEKRYLMSFLEKCFRIERHGDWYREYARRPFIEFLRTQTLTEKLQEFIINTLLMQSQDTDTDTALNKISFFLRSFGRFCDRPFLFPLYGSEDIIQAFCRYGAVWGGSYCLDVSIDGIIVNKSNQRCQSILVNNGTRIGCDNLITDYEFDDIKPMRLNEQKIMARAIVLSTKSIKAIDTDNEMGDLSFIHLSPKFTHLNTSVYCFETDYSSRLCPRHFYLQHFWCESSGQSSTAKQLLEPVVKKLCELDRESTTTLDLPFELRNKILMSIYYNYYSPIVDYTHPNDNTKDENNSIPMNIRQIQMTIDEFNYENAVRQAEKIFHELYPDDEFFPMTEKQCEQSSIDDDLDDDQ